MSDAGALMDSIYAPQRHIYDVTRKYYLLGRDGLIADLQPPRNGRVLEIGCGTARNLIEVARRYPDAECYGIDISRAMLDTARNSVARAGLASRIRLAEADAAHFEPRNLFDVALFDRIFIAYALSMIPPWQAVLQRAAALLAPGGSLRLVDFGDQANLPPAFKRLLLAWLARFHVSPRADLPEAVRALSRDDELRASVRHVLRGYAVSASLTRS